MIRKRLLALSAGVMMIAASVLSGCGKEDNTTTVNNGENSQVEQTQESGSNKEEKSANNDNEQLESQMSIFNGFTAQIPKGYVCTGTGGIIIFNSSDKRDLYISKSFGEKKTVPLSDISQDKIAENISKLLWIDGGISEHISGYTKNVPVTVTSIIDTEVNGMQMKKFEGKLTLAKSSSDKETTWDCYIYGYVFETGINTVSFFGLEQEQSQPSDKIELIKKNMDAMIKTVKLI